MSEFVANKVNIYARRDWQSTSSGQLRKTSFPKQKGEKGLVQALREREQNTFFLRALCTDEVIPAVKNYKIKVWR